jgi:hypothetical protein
MNRGENATEKESAMRRAGSPIEIGGDRAERLERVPLNEPIFREDWLQRLIHENPDLLPINEIRSSIGPLTALGREIGTSVGTIDNLLVDPQGTLVVIETKLWRNPQARREVVGQVIDYAAALSRISFEELDFAVRTSTGGKGITEIVGVDELERQHLIDGISRSLGNGDLVLLVVGDGIREDVEGIADLLGRAPHLAFTFGLIELAVYRALSGNTVVVPTVVAHSVEITRTTIRVETLADGRVNVSVATLTDDDVAAPTKRQKLDASTFEAELRRHVGPATLQELLAWRDQIAADPRLKVDYMSASMVFRIKPIGISRPFTGLLIDKTGYLSIGWLHGQVTGIGAPETVATAFARDTAALVGAAPPTRYPDAWGDGTGDTGFVHIDEALSQRDALTARMLQVADELETALHH